jgi:hypothetical protein
MRSAGGSEASLEQAQQRSMQIERAMFFIWIPETAG